MGKMVGVVEAMPAEQAEVLGIAISAIVDAVAFGDSPVKSRNLRLLGELLNQNFNVRFHVIDTLMVSIVHDLDKSGALLMGDIVDEKPDLGRHLLYYAENGDLGMYEGSWKEAPKALHLVRECMNAAYGLSERQSVEFNAKTLSPYFTDKVVFSQIVAILSTSAALARVKREEGEKLIRAFDDALRLRHDG
jgi:hypothetical protein